MWIPEIDIVYFGLSLPLPSHLFIPWIAKFDYQTFRILQDQEITIRELDSGHSYIELKKLVEHRPRKLRLCVVKAGSLKDA